METIEEAKKFVMRNMLKGCKCPVCNKNVKAQKVKFDKQKASVLLAFLGMTNKLRPLDGWLETNDFPRNSSIASVNITRGVHGKLVHWGLLQKRPDSKKYRITDAGRAFAEGLTAIYKVVWLYNGQKLTFDPEFGKIRMTEALETPYDEGETK